ncbi:MAG: DUF3299 domain-containing protein [Bacteroidetes bacterium]|jgi:hypothetical protein|nr:DUF3299 domain-containing protein [Bacteroidota bacterium]
MTRFLSLAPVLIVGLLSVAFLPGEEFRTVRWWMLQDVSFEDVYDAERDQYFLKPIFGEKVLALNNQLIEISGYVIPVDVSGGLYVLSAYPFSACYFCGGAGPESVMQLNFKAIPKEKLKTDDYISFRGRLKLNSTNYEDLNYILLNAEKAPEGDK